MAKKTLLNAVNEVLKDVRVIAGDSGELTSLTDSGRQPFVDSAVKVINQGIEELYTVSEIPMPTEQYEDQIALATGVRLYALPDDLVQLRFPLIDKTNTQYIYEHPGGYNTILTWDPEEDNEGLPQFGAISPVDDQLYLDRTPTATENARIYTFQYHRDVSLSAITDRVPFKDVVFRAMVPAWAELWKRLNRREFDREMYRANIGRASRLLSQVEPRTSWSPR